MKKKPLIFSILAILLLIEPLVKLLYFRLETGFDLTRILENILSEDSMLNIFEFWIVYPLAGLCLFRIRKVTYFLFLAIQAYSIYTILSYEPYTWPYYSQSPFIYNYFLLIMNVAIIIYFLLPRVRRPFFDQRVRWWETKARYNIHLPCQLIFTNRNLEAEILNISQTGVFVKEIPGIVVGDKTMIAFGHNNLQFHLPAQIISKHQFEGNRGFGLKFSFDDVLAMFKMRYFIFKIKGEASRADR